MRPNIAPMRIFSVIFSAVIVLALSGCTKSESPCSTALTAAEEDAKMQEYIKANSLTMSKHPNGLYYQVIEPGTGATPTKNSTVKATYTGKFTNNKNFDAGTHEFPLNGVIEGWTIGIPLISKGGKIKLVIPPSLGYGNCNYQSIPKNSILVFDVELLDVK